MLHGPNEIGTSSVFCICTAENARLRIGGWWVWVHRWCGWGARADRVELYCTGVHVPCRSLKSMFSPFIFRAAVCVFAQHILLLVVGCMKGSTASHGASRHHYNPATDTVQRRIRNETSSKGWQLLLVLLICAPQTSALSAAHAFQRRQEMVCKWMSTRPRNSSFLRQFCEAMSCARGMQESHSGSDVQGWSASVIRAMAARLYASQISSSWQTLHAA